jgi:hypothetical protein
MQSSGKNGVTSMNKVFKRIQAKYETCEDEKKPKVYTSGLTSHSMRAGAEQLMHECSLLRREWSDRRVGRCKRSDSRESYISSNSWQDDYACALVLNGWPSIHWGGKCPTKSCIPETDHRSFDEFIGAIFTRVSMVPVRILEIWGCSLLLWHFEVKELNSECDVVLKVESLLSSATLQQWHECVREEFKMQNQSTLPLQTVQQLSIAENLSWQNTSIGKLEENVRFLTTCYGTQDRFNTAVVERLDILQETSQSNSVMLQRIYDAMSTLQPGPKRRKVNNNESPVVLVQGLIPFQQAEPHPQQTSSAAVQHGGEGVERQSIVNDEPAVSSAIIDREIRIKPLAERLYNIETVFYSWYIEELWNYQGGTADERSYLKNTISSLVLYMKRFLPADCTILLEKPPEIEVERRRVWIEKLRILSITAKERTMTFIQDYHTSVKKKPLGTCVIRKALTYATRKHLMQIPVHNFPPQLIVDRITQSTPYVYNNVDLQSFHKCK